MSKSNDTIQKTVIVALALCLVCSVIVSSAAVLLKPTQIVNRTLNVKENILRAAGMIDGKATKAVIEQTFSQITPVIVDLETGDVVEPSAAGFASMEAFDQKKVAQQPATSMSLTSAEDMAGIKRRERYAKVYLVKEGDAISRVILPVRGYGLWSTLYGFMALKGDANTVVGLGFYEHAETPGLGGEVDNPNWKGQWPDKLIYNDDGEVAVSLMKGGVDPESAKAKYSVDSLAGATLTSRGVENLLRYWLGEAGFKQFLTKLRAGEISNV